MERASGHPEKKNDMKLQAFGDTIKEIIGGTPMEVSAKALVAIAVAMCPDGNASK